MPNAVVAKRFGKDLSDPPTHMESAFGLRQMSC
jgi:hypothetical protein